MAFFLAIFLVPSARQVVMTAGRPSGMAATARATFNVFGGWGWGWVGALQVALLAGHSAIPHIGQQADLNITGSSIVRIRSEGLTAILK
jgi:hypothetical protein